MKSLVLAAMVILVVFPAVVMAADFADLAEYRVVGDTSVSLAEVIDLFIPSLSGGAKFLSPKVNGLGLIHRWNPQLADATWQTRLQPGDSLRLPQEWVLRGVQNILEPAQISSELSTEVKIPTGQYFWLMNIGMLFCAAGIFWIYLYSRLWHRRGDR